MFSSENRFQTTATITTTTTTTTTTSTTTNLLLPPLPDILFLVCNVTLFLSALFSTTFHNIRCFLVIPKAAMFKLMS